MIIIKLIYSLSFFLFEITLSKQWLLGYSIKYFLKICVLNCLGVFKCRGVKQAQLIGIKRFFISMNSMKKERLP
jgi:hypothetical protein